MGAIEMTSDAVDVRVEVLTSGLDENEQPSQTSFHIALQGH